MIKAVYYVRTSSTGRITIGDCLNEVTVHWGSTVVCLQRLASTQSILELNLHKFYLCVGNASLACTQIHLCLIFMCDIACDISCLHWSFNLCLSGTTIHHCLNTFQEPRVEEWTRLCTYPWSPIRGSGHWYYDCRWVSSGDEARSMGPSLIATQVRLLPTGYLSTVSTFTLFISSCDWQYLCRSLFMSSPEGQKD